MVSADLELRAKALQAEEIQAVALTQAAVAAELAV
jgi:hypothetical protein